MLCKATCLLGGDLGLVDGSPAVEDVGTGCFLTGLGWVTNRALGVGGWKIGLT